MEMRKISVILSLALLLLAFFSLGRPASAADVVVLNGLSHQKNAQPGESYQGVIQFLNKSDKPSQVKIYQTDYLFYSDGRNLYGTPGKDPRSNANWFKVEPNLITVPPGSTTNLNYTVTVPNDPKLKGTYWSMVMVEPLAESAEAMKPEKGKVKVGITTVIRYGVQIATNIGETGDRQIKFTSVKLVKDQGKNVLMVEAINNGERLLRLKFNTELYDQTGQLQGRYEGNQLLVYPTCSVRGQILLPDLKPGTYRALVLADNGDDFVFGAQYNLKLGEQPDSKARKKPKKNPAVK